MLPKTTHKYYPELDGVRAIAILLVMYLHARQEGIMLRGPVNFGKTGVDLFFVLSGFLITSILLKSRPRDWGEVKTFLIRRTLRIFPLYYFYLLLDGIVFHHWVWKPYVFLQDIGMALNYPNSGPSHFWSLAIEEHFYMVWPFVVLFAGRKYLLPTLWTTVGAAVVLRYILSTHGVAVYYFPLTRMDGLAAGGLIAVYLWRGTLANYRRLLVAGFFAGIVACFFLAVKFANTDSPTFAAVRYLAVTAMYASAIGYLIVTPSSIAVKALRWRPLRWIGRISYGIYVYHMVTFYLITPHVAGLPVALQALIVFTAAIAVAAVSWYLFERHLIALKDRFAPERRPTPSAPIAV